VRRRVKVGLATLAAVQSYRWLRVATSVQRHEGHWVRRRLRPGELRYAALGDSLAQGIGASHPERGYVGLLAARLEHVTGLGVEIVNLSATGILIDDVTRYQLPALLELEPPPDVVTLTAGTNDAGRRDHPGIGTRFDALCARLPPGTLVADLPEFHHGRRGAAARHAAAAIRDVLSRHPHLVTVRLAEATANTGLAMRSADLFHPNDRGHRTYANQFWSALEPRLPTLLP
jgi:acyl-CoA thioesterase-1